MVEKAGPDGGVNLLPPGQAVYDAISIPNPWRRAGMLLWTDIVWKVD
jgi:hypothetical protein